MLEQRKILISEYFNSEKVPKENVKCIMKACGVKYAHISIITGRCGSTYLSNVCKLLDFGLGEEPFNERCIEDYLSDGINPDDVIKFLEITVKRATKDGIMYFQITPERLNDLSKIVDINLILDEYSKITLLFRRNIIAQALSYHNALKSGVWHIYEDVGVEKTTDEANSVDIGAVTEWVFRLKELEELAIRQQRSLTGAPAVCFFYEDLIAAPLETLTTFFNFHNYYPGPIRFAEILLGENGPKKISRKNFAVDYTKVLHSSPSLVNLLIERAHRFRQQD